MNNNAKRIQDLFDALPKSLQDVVYRGPLDKDLEDIAAEFNISKEDLAQIKSEVMLVVVTAHKTEEIEQTILQIPTIDKQNVKKICDEIIQKIILPLEAERGIESHPDKGTIIDEIENPTPARPSFSKPFVSNPAGQNVVLDAQHNLPEQEKKVLISSAAVPSRGPLIGSVKSTFNPTPTVPPISQPKPAAPVQTYPFSTTPQPTQTPKIVLTQPKAPIPPAPEKYSVDPYREAAE